MRCEHLVEKRWGRGLRPWRHRLKSFSMKPVGRLTWHVYRCRRGHETRFYVRP